MSARHVRIYFQTGAPLVMVIVWYILLIYIIYYPVSLLEWPIIMTKQLLIICEWCSHRLFRSIRVWSWLENLKRVFSVIWLSWLWSCQVVPLAVWSCRGSRKPKLSLNLWQKPDRIKPEFVVKAWIKHIVVAKTIISMKLSRNLYIYSFW